MTLNVWTLSKVHAVLHKKLGLWTTRSSSDDFNHKKTSWLEIIKGPCIWNIKRCMYLHTHCTLYTVQHMYPQLYRSYPLQWGIYWDTYPSPLLAWSLHWQKKLVIFRGVYQWFWRCSSVPFQAFLDKIQAEKSAKFFNFFLRVRRYLC
jgi:hypothetical protein